MADQKILEHAKADLDGHCLRRWGHRLIASFGVAEIAGNDPSDVIDLSLRRAAAGLIAAACVQVAVCVVVTRSGYPTAFSALVFPLFLVLSTVGVNRLLSSRRPTVWMVALCGLFAVFSLTATWAIREHYTGGLNVAEPLIGLGTFGAGISGGVWSRSAAVTLIAVHRGALVLAGTGFPSEHAILTLIECGSLTSAIIGSSLVRAYGRKLNATETALQHEAAVDAEASARNAAVRERSRLVHDAPVNLLWRVAKNIGADSAEFRHACARDAELLRGKVELSGPARSLVQALDDLVADFRKRGLRIRVTDGDKATYPEEPRLVTALARAVEQALVNVLWHSGRDEADVVVTAQAGRISIQVRDHGRGFVREATADRLGSRMSIEQRMRDVGGDARVASEEGRGTTVTLWWPR
jgi:hypothetical protein